MIGPENESQLDSLQNGQGVEIIGKQQGAGGERWIKIRYSKTKEGWVLREFIHPQQRKLIPGRVLTSRRS